MKFLVIENFSKFLEGCRPKRKKREAWVDGTPREKVRFLDPRRSNR